MTPQAAALAARSGPTIAINNTFRLAQSSMLYAADAEWWSHKDNADAHCFDGLKVSVSRCRGVKFIRNAGVVGYSDANDCIHSYGNSGAQALQIAAKAGAARILLFGFDMHGAHWHPAHPAPLRNTEPQTFTKWIERFNVLAMALKLRHVLVLNCTRGSALKCFEFADEGDVF